MKRLRNLSLNKRKILIGNLFTKLPILAKAAGKIGGFSGVVNQELMGFIGFATNAATGCTIASSLFAGQAVGGCLDFMDGCVDLGEEKYHDNGGAESGTFVGACGNVVSSTAVGAFSYLQSTGKLIEKFPGLKGCGSLLQKIGQGMFLWQSATLVDEVWNGDGDGTKDVLDIVGNVVSLLSLTAMFRGGGSAAASKLLTKKKPGGGSSGLGLSRPKNRPPTLDSGRKRLATSSHTATHYNATKTRSMAFSALSSAA